MFEKVKQAIHVGRHVTDIMRGWRWPSWQRGRRYDWRGAGRVKRPTPCPSLLREWSKNLEA